MPLIEYYGLLFEWHDKKMDLVYRGREITFEEVCNLSSMKYFSFLASFGKLAYLDLSNKPL